MALFYSFDSTKQGRERSVTVNAEGVRFQPSARPLGRHPSSTLPAPVGQPSNCGAMSNPLRRRPHDEKPSRAACEDPDYETNAADDGASTTDAHLHSSRRTRIGSTRAARSAGHADESTALTMVSRSAPANVGTSNGETP